MIPNSAFVFLLHFWCQSSTSSLTSSPPILSQCLNLIYMNLSASQNLLKHFLQIIFLISTFCFYCTFRYLVLYLPPNCSLYNYKNLYIVGKIASKDDVKSLLYLLSITLCISVLSFSLQRLWKHFFWGSFTYFGFLLQFLNNSFKTPSSHIWIWVRDGVRESLWNYGKEEEVGREEEEWNISSSISSSSFLFAIVPSCLLLLLHLGFIPPS